jgi:hypothetical protein
MSRLIPAHPELSAEGKVITIELSWGAISDGYKSTMDYWLYRAEGTDPTIWTQVAFQTGTTYVDSAVVFGTTYRYYVVGLYADGKRTPWSNIVNATTTGLAYLYFFRDGAVDVIDVQDLENPFLAASLGIGISGHPVLEYMDEHYIYLHTTSNGDVGRVYVLDWSTNKLLPVIKKTITNAGDQPIGGLLVRKNLPTYNNLMFTLLNSGIYYVASYNIADPENPILINQRTLPNGNPMDGTFAFDAITGRLYYGYASGGGSGIGYLSVDPDGTLQAGNTLSISGGNYVVQSGFLFGGNYWVYMPPNAAYLGYSTTGGIGAGGPFIAKEFGNLPVRVYDDHIIIARYIAHASEYPIQIYNNDSNPTLVKTIGSLNGTVASMFTALHYLFFTQGSVLYVYDIADVANPTLFTSFAIPTTELSGASFPSSGWDGQNGLCIT